MIHHKKEKERQDKKRQIRDQRNRKIERWKVDEKEKGNDKITR